MKRLFTIGVSLTCFTMAYAGQYGEHKHIGDVSFNQFTQQFNLTGFFKDTLAMGQFGINYPIPFNKNKCIQANYKDLFAISDSLHQYSYGDLCALSGDHTVDPIQLFQGLFTKDYYINPARSKAFHKLIPQMQRVVLMQNKALENYLNESNCSSIGYLLLANDNASHFQIPGLSVQDMLAKIDPSIFQLIVQFNLHKNDNNSLYLIYLRKRLAIQFLHLNNTSKYVIIHAIALDYMNNAAIAYCEGDHDAMVRNFQFSLIFNAFGDHFLQDAFSAGHLPVKRKCRGFDDLGVHNYYSRLGLNVSNRAGQKWHTYGDNYYDSTTYVIAVLANNNSLADLWLYFNHSRQAFAAALAQSPEQPSPVSLLKLVNNKVLPLPYFIDTALHQFTAFQFTPIPLTSLQYKQDIALKHGSKSGGFIDVGILQYLQNGAQQTAWTTAWGMGFDFTPAHLNASQYALYHSGQRETVHWAACSFNYAQSCRGPYNYHELTLKLQYTYYDRLSFALQSGIQNGPNNIFLIRPQIGYEFKKVASPIATALHLYYNISPSQPAGLGLALALRMY